MSGITIKNIGVTGETIPLTCVANAVVTAKFALPGSWTAPDCLVQNNGSTIAFFGFGSTAVNNATGSTTTTQAPGLTGTQNCTPILPGAVMTVSKDDLQQGCDICVAYSTGTPQLYFTACTGS